MTLLLVRWSEDVKSLPRSSWPHVAVPRSLVDCGTETRHHVADVFVLLLLHQTCHYAHQIRSTGRNPHVVQISFKYVGYLMLCVVCSVSSRTLACHVTTAARNGLRDH